MTKIRLTTTNLPRGGANFYRPDFRTLPIEEIEDILQDDLKAYQAVGYNSFTLHRPTGTVSVRKIEISTMDDIFETDIYGILNQTK